MLTVISGYGQYHTNEFDEGNSNRRLTPYKSISFEEIQSIVDSPKAVPKNRGQWIIPSSFHSRSFEEQSKNGSYWLLWADLDTQPKPITYVRDTLLEILSSDFEIYTTRSAAKENPKARILIPLAKALSPQDWVLSQQTLNKLLCQSGITPDKVNERYAQLCYLPNKGEYYESASIRNGNYFHTSTWLTLSTERTEFTDDYRGLLKRTENTDVIVDALVMDYTKLPLDCCPKEEGQRNITLFTFGRYLKQRHPDESFDYLRPLVLGWHKHFIDAIGTKNFSETWADFRRGWAAIKVPYGQGIESIVDGIDFGIPIPQTFLDLGYGTIEFKLLLICRQLQLVNGDAPFFLSARTAEKLINYHFTGAAKMLDALVSDKFLELITKGKTPKASRYKYIWKDLNDIHMQ